MDMKLPELGENIETATVGGVLVSEGDRVEADQPILEVETDKATAEVPSEAAGVVREIRVSTGDEVKVGQVLVVIDEASEDAGDANRAEEEEEKEPSPPEEEEPAKDETPPEEPEEPEREAERETKRARDEPEPARDEPASDEPEPEPARDEPEPEREDLPSREHVPASPAVRRLARELGVDVASVSGSGPGGRISIDDVKNHVRSRGGAGGGATAGPAPSLPDFAAHTEVRREPMSTIRKKTAENLSRAWTTIPHVTNFDEADVTDLDDVREEWADRAEAMGARLTVTAIVLRVVAAALRAHPKLNASVDTERGEIVYKESVHVGVAVDTPRGLLVPVVRDADRKSVLAIAAELGDLSTRAREGKLALDEMRGGTFSVSNLGGLGTMHFTPIVNWPEVAILGVGRAVERVEPGGEVLETRTFLPLSLSYDHRLVDGADAARFLRWVAEALERPIKLIME